MPGWRDDFDYSKGDDLGIESACFKSSTICGQVSVFGNIFRGDLPTPEENKDREKYAGKVAEE
jgi:hypothetical protein